MTLLLWPLVALLLPVLAGEGIALMLRRVVARWRWRWRWGRLVRRVPSLTPPISSIFGEPVMAPGGRLLTGSRTRLATPFRCRGSRSARCCEQPDRLHLLLHHGELCAHVGAQLGHGLLHDLEARLRVRRQLWLEARFLCVRARLLAATLRLRIQIVDLDALPL